MNLKKTFLLSVSLLTIVSSAFAFTGSYYQTISLEEKVVVEFRVTADGDKVRTEFPKSPQAEVVVKNNEGTYRYSPSQKTAIKLPDNIETGSLLDDMNDYQAFLSANNGEKQGEEKIGEYETTVYTFIDPLTQKEAKAWVWNDKNFPVRILVNAPEGALQVDLSEIDLDNAVDPSVFELPEGTNVVDIQEALGQIPQAQTN